MINFKFSCGSEHIDRWCGKPKKYSCPYWERTHTHTHKEFLLFVRGNKHTYMKEFKRVLNVRVRTEKHTDRWRGNTRTGDLSLSFTGFSFTHYSFIYLPSLSLTLDSFVCHFHRTFTYSLSHCTTIHNSAAAPLSYRSLLLIISQLPLTSSQSSLVIYASCRRSGATASSPSFFFVIFAYITDPFIN